MLKFREGVSIQDNIYLGGSASPSQAEEVELRKRVACELPENVLKRISRHHSVPVMDKEVFLFLKLIPKNGIVLDVGGCWGWHWRRIGEIRPDVKIAVLDFVKENLLTAKSFLADLVNKNVFLVQGDAQTLPFEDDIFDGYWTVQTLQHVPDFRKTVEEARRVLKPNGFFSNYSLNNQHPIRALYRMCGVNYCVEGKVKGKFFLARASEKQRKIVDSIFGKPSQVRFSEILFKPELGVSFMGTEKSLTGRIDSFLSGSWSPLSLIARQQSFHISK